MLMQGSAKAAALCRQAPKSLRVAFNSTQAAPNVQKSAANKWRLGLAAVGSATAASIVYAMESRVNAGELELHSSSLPFSHYGFNKSLDMASVRRGYLVYKQVCAACHSMRFICYRHFVNVFMTEEEAKAEAAEAMINDLDDDGKPTQRPGILTDTLPSPYPNDKAAAAANNGAIPPDLSVVTLSRHGGEDYVFSLLTGYVEPPAGVKVDEGKAFNPYFPGGIIGMAQQLFDEGVEYEDGTPATQSQQAKDVSTFLAWSAEPYHDTRKIWAIKALVFLVPMTVFALYWKKHVWSYVKSQKVAFRTLKGREPPSAKPH